MTDAYKKVNSGAPLPHRCMSDMPWPLGHHSTGTEVGAIWKCSCERYYKVVPDMFLPKWEEVLDADGHRMPRRSPWQVFLDWWN